MPSGSKAAKWLVICFLAAVSIPFLYNACQPFQAVSVVTPYYSFATCKYMIESGERKAVRRSDAVSKFASRKVLLSSTDERTTAGSVNLSQGTRLSVILDNACLRNSSLPASPFLNEILAGAKPRPEFSRQAFTYTLNRNTTQATLETSAQNEPCVIGMSRHNVYRTQQLPPTPSPIPTGPPGMNFSDPMISMQNHLTAINALQGDYLFYGEPYGMPMAASRPVIVAVLDSGIDYTHPDLEPNIWQDSEGFGIDITTLTATVNYNPMDISPYGHGTHVSGIIGAVSNNGVGIVGTMPFNVQVMAIKIFVADSTQSGGVSTTTSDFFNGVEFAIENGADVINLSIDSTDGTYDAVAQEALQDSLAVGIPVIVAVGNGNPNGELIDGTTLNVVPAIYSTMAGVIGVAAFDSDTGNLSYFSNYSTTYAEIAAPGTESVGQGIFSTLPLTLNAYGPLMGTSVAAPMVSAAAALTIGWIRSAYGVSPSAAEVERLITSSSDSSPLLVNYVRNGNRLDLYNLAVAIQQEYPRTAGTGPTQLPAPISCN